MEQQRNTKCWYSATCTDDCEKCTVYLQLKWQMDNSGLYESQQAPISLFIHDYNQVDTRAFDRLAEIRKDIVKFVEDGNNLYIC